MKYSIITKVFHNYKYLFISYRLAVWAFLFGCNYLQAHQSATECTICHLQIPAVKISLQIHSIGLLSARILNTKAC